MVTRCEKCGWPLDEDEFCTNPSCEDSWEDDEVPEEEETA